MREHDVEGYVAIAISLCDNMKAEGKMGRTGLKDCTSD